MTRSRAMIVLWFGLVAALLFLFYLFRPILLPFVAGAAFAYALTPVADHLERGGVPRGLACLLILGAASLFMVLMAFLLGPLLVTQAFDLIERLPTLITRLQELAGSAIDSEWARFLGLDASSLHDSLTAMISQGLTLATGVLGSIWTGGRALIDLGSLLIVTPFVAYYVMRDWHKIVARVDALVPRDETEVVRRLASDIDEKVAAFVRGQVLVGFILGIFYAGALVLVGLNYGLLVGIAAGLLSFIPYLGFAVGFTVSILIAVVQYWPEWPWIAAVIGVFVVGEFLEGYVLQPRLLGPNVGLHPIWVIFALLAFGSLFGFVGLLLAIPLAAAVGVLLRFGIQRYRTSALYGGPSDDPA